jgi:hypothetical protein
MYHYAIFQLPICGLNLNGQSIREDKRPGTSSFRFLVPISMFPSLTERHGKIRASCFEFFAQVGLAKRDNDRSQIEQIREFVRIRDHGGSNLSTNDG